ncbi:2-hydroxyacid dehydrogenase [Candidatus Nitromaritima sp. SCGC AAA799-C22]|nr:2-hydroxyacid dehydrogenase [Candidatus Nitromaritima sp. SCGC AAA799-C22]
MKVERNILVYMTHPHVDAWNFKQAHADLLEKRVPGSRVTICPNSREFLDCLPDAETVIVWFFKREWLEKAPRLKCIATPAAGKDWIEVEPGNGLQISYGSFHGPMIAESVVGAVFYFLKTFRFSREMQLQRKWARVKISQRLGSLKGARVTVLGFGRIGRTIGKFLKPYGCAITGVKRAPSPVPDYFAESDRIVTVGMIPEVLETTDHLILALPGGPETDGLLTREYLNKLPSNCYLYNVGRGNVVREADLADALGKGKLAGAYLDVFAVEPLPEESPLWEMDNVLLQPHLSAASPQYLELFVEELSERIRLGEI